MFAIALLSPAAGFSQSGPAVVNAAGTTLTSTSGYSHSFSIGEIAITTISSPNNQNYITQGYLQPETGERPVFDFYPNPVVDNLFLVNASKIKQIRVYDLTGREVLTLKYTGEALPLQLLSGATYLVDAFDEKGKSVQKFTIIKQ